MWFIVLNMWFSLLPCGLGEAVTCIWEISHIKTQDPWKGTVNLLDEVPLANITEQVQQMNIPLWKNSVGEDLFAYPYSILLKNKCNDGKNQVVASDILERSIRLAGVQPCVTFCGWPGKLQNRAAVCRHALSIPVDTAYDTDGEASNCSYELCSPSWLVPLQWDVASVAMTFLVQGGYIPSLYPSKSVNLKHAGYERLFVSEVEYGNISLSRPLAFLPTQSPSLIIGPLGNQSEIFLSNDEFESVLSPKAEFWPREELNECDCLHSTQDVFESAILSDRILILTKSGLQEIIGSFAFPESAPGADTLADGLSFRGCASQIVLSRQSCEHQQYIVLIGACRQHGKVFVAKTYARSPEPLSFEEVVGADGGGPCSAVDDSHVATCGVHVCAVSAITAGNPLCVLDVTYTDRADTYHLVTFSGALGEGNWTYLFRIDRNLTIPSPFRDPMHLLWLPHVHGPTQLLTLHGMSVAELSSTAVYLWGSHVLYSPDSGRNVYLMPWTLPSHITMSVTERQGTVVFKTTANELLVTTLYGHKMRQVYPSAAWDLLFGLQEKEPNIVSMFFDDERILQLLTLNSDGGLTKQTVPVHRLLHALALADYWNARPFNLTRGLSFLNPCLFRSVKFRIPIPKKFTRTKMFSYHPPYLTGSVFHHPYTSVLVYHALIASMERFYLRRSTTDFRRGTYDEPYSSSVEKWKHQWNSTQPYQDFIFAREQTGSPIHVDVDGFDRLFESPQNDLDRLPEVIYLEREETFAFQLLLTLRRPESESAKLVDTTDLLRLSIQQSHNDLLSVKAKKLTYHLNNSVLYEISISDTGRLERQRPPGVDMCPASVQISVWGAPLTCYQFTESGGVQPLGVYSISVQLGCPPAQYLRFDFEATVAKLVEFKETNFDCVHPDPELPCFYFENAFYPSFRVHDEATGESWLYEGNYTLVVIGGGDGSPDHIRRFSQEEVQLYNNRNYASSNVLMMGPSLVNTTLYDGWPVYNHQFNGIRWLCLPGSPCSNVKPHFPVAPEYLFLLEFSTKDVALGSTYCDLNLKFLVRLHGLPTDEINMSVVLVAVCLGVMSVLTLIFYVCMLKNKALWKGVRWLILCKWGTSPVAVHPSNDKDDAQIRAVVAEDTYPDHYRVPSFEKRAERVTHDLGEVLAEEEEEEEEGEDVVESDHFEAADEEMTDKMAAKMADKMADEVAEDAEEDDVSEESDLSDQADEREEVEVYSPTSGDAVDHFITEYDSNH